jgi:hypothetical protein
LGLFFNFFKNILKIGWLCSMFFFGQNFTTWQQKKKGGGGEGLGIVFAKFTIF